jgi:galactokinase
MDQTASAMGRAGFALLFDTRSLEVRYEPFPADLEIVLCDTNKRRSLDVSAYNDRRRECEEAAQDLGAPLRDVTVERVRGTYAQGTEVKAKRARHVVTENERCVQLAKALSESDKSQIGRLMKASHLSLRDDYEVSCPELDWMAESCWEATGCVGARMTGAGFGGACVALVEARSLKPFLNDARRGFLDRSDGREPTFMVCKTADGAGPV